MGSIESLGFAFFSHTVSEMNNKIICNFFCVVVSFFLFNLFINKSVNPLNPC